jgi:hypothetical protein
MRTLSSVNNRVKFENNLQKKNINIQGGLKFRKPSTLLVNWVSSWLSFVLSSSIAVTYIFTACTCIPSYYRYSETLCIKFWVSAFHTQDLIKFPYFTDNTESGVWWWKEAQTQGEDMVTLRISLLIGFLYGLYSFNFIWYLLRDLLII